MSRARLRWLATDRLEAANVIVIVTVIVIVIGRARVRCITTNRLETELLLSN